LESKALALDRKMNTATIKFSSNILRRLGEELNPNPERGLIELIKNAYDADARHCTIELNNITKPGGTIRITDDGDGMDAAAIKERWLVLGRSKKNQEQPTKLGRIPSGDKGLGRLAALRMGSMVTLTTIPQQVQITEYSLYIDWERYQQAELVEDIELNIIEKTYPQAQPSGTQIIVENLQTPITQTNIKQLARAILLLADPFADNPTGFKPVLKVPEFQDLEKLVENRYFNDAEFHLIAKTDEQGFSRASVVDWQGKELFKAEHADLRPKKNNIPYFCHNIQFELWMFILDRATFSTRKTTVTEVRKWLKAFGGVHFYYNGLRVSPYGDEGDDWLGMNLMRAQVHYVRPTTTSSIGRVMITDTGNHLMQTTDRSGFIQNEAFLEIRQFAREALQWMERRRQNEAETQRAKMLAEASSKSGLARQAVKNAIAILPEKERLEIEQHFEKYDKTRNDEVDKLKKEIQLYRTLSTTGITSAVFAHESVNNPIKVIAQVINSIRTRSMKYLSEDIYTQKLQGPIDLIIRAIDSLRVLGNVTLSLVDHEKRRNSQVDIHKVIQTVIEIFQPFLKTRDTQIITEFGTGQPYLRGSIAAMESVITNLFNNSLFAFEGNPPGERLIIVRTAIFTDLIEIHVIDNGPGIEGISTKDIWLPGQTTRENGTGLGLTIVRDAITDLGGKVEAIAKGELDGAEIIIHLPILGA
jgi:C4-dicarboxylate-specific signal transduction histidine kinase